VSARNQAARIVIFVVVIVGTLLPSLRLASAP